MNEFATEIIELSNAASASPEMSYKPIYIVTDKRQADPALTTMKYLQVGGPGVADKIGNALGAIMKVEFVDTNSIATATHIKIWGVHNNDASAVVYPKAHLHGKILDIMLDKFEFTDASGNIATNSGSAIIFGHRRNTTPFV